jgi:hypothetical protein
LSQANIETQMARFNLSVAKNFARMSFPFNCVAFDIVPTRTGSSCIHRMNRNKSGAEVPLKAFNHVGLLASGSPRPPGDDLWFIWTSDEFAATIGTSMKIVPLPAKGVLA